MIQINIGRFLFWLNIFLALFSVVDTIQGTYIERDREWSKSPRIINIFHDEQRVLNRDKDR